MTHVLVGSGGLATEVLALLRATGDDTEVVVLDDDPSTWGRTLHGHPITGGTDSVKDYPEHDVLICVGRGSGRRAVASRLAELGVGDGRFPPLVHPSADVAPGCSVGPGSIVLAQVVLTGAVSVGRHVVVMPHVTITHDDVVDDFATLCAGVSLGGRVRVGEAAYLGMNASVREDITVGRDATLAMGAALVRDLPAGEVWAGVPARAIHPGPTEPRDGDVR